MEEAIAEICSATEDCKVLDTLQNTALYCRLYPIFPDEVYMLKLKQVKILDCPFKCIAITVFSFFNVCFS